MDLLCKLVLVLPGLNTLILILSSSWNLKTSFNSDVLSEADTQLVLTTDVNWLWQWPENRPLHTSTYRSKIATEIKCVTRSITVSSCVLCRSCRSLAKQMRPEMLPLRRWWPTSTSRWFGDIFNFRTSDAADAHKLHLLML